jgi:hypothetical protein
MIRLHVAYHGFKLGVRIADQLALCLDVHKPTDVQVLHKLKNMAYIMQSMTNFKAFEINHEVYAPKD